MRVWLIMKVFVCGNACVFVCWRCVIMMVFARVCACTCLCVCVILVVIACGYVIVCVRLWCVCVGVGVCMCVRMSVVCRFRVLLFVCWHLFVCRMCGGGVVCVCVRLYVCLCACVC